MRFGMVIDLQRCVGCGACAFACKAENNTRTRGDGQSFNWADFVMKTEGTFPNVTHWVMPVLCNHCSDAPCVKICPTEPKAMFKTPEGVTMHDTTLCIGCRRCQRACPYSARELGAGKPERRDLQRHQLQPRGQAHAALLGGQDGDHPGLHLRRGRRGQGRRRGDPGAERVRRGRHEERSAREGVVEKCTFCYHRTSNGLQPACVEVCPSKARIFGDQDDPKAEIAKVLKAKKSFRLQEEKGTKPNVHYIDKYSARA